MIPPDFLCLGGSWRSVFHWAQAVDRFEKKKTTAYSLNRWWTDVIRRVASVVCFHQRTSDFMDLLHVSCKCQSMITRSAVGSSTMVAYCNGWHELLLLLLEMMLKPPGELNCSTIKVWNLIRGFSVFNPRAFCSCKYHGPHCPTPLFSSSGIWALAMSLCVWSCVKIAHVRQSTSWKSFGSDHDRCTKRTWTVIWCYLHVLFFLPNQLGLFMSIPIWHYWRVRIWIHGLAMTSMH